jgi:hypothetical protein
MVPLTPQPAVADYRHPGQIRLPPEHHSATASALAGSGIAALPAESTFSPAFAALAATGTPTQIHEAPIGNTQQNRTFDYIARDAAAIEVRERLLEEGDKMHPAKDGNQFAAFSHIYITATIIIVYSKSFLCPGTRPGSLSYSGQFLTRHPFINGTTS